MHVLDRENGKRELYRGKVFIDATYEGDLAAAVGVPYRLGRENQSEFEEPMAGQLYRQWDGPLGAGSTGLGDNAIQAYNYPPPFTPTQTTRLPLPTPPHI